MDATGAGAAGVARADVCRFLAACYYEPGPEFAEEGLFDSLREAAGRVDPGLGARAGRLGEAFAALDLETLLVDYTRLFLGPAGAPARPYGALWLDGTGGLMGASTRDVLALYREGGFDLAQDFREAPDHVAAELEFLYLLLFRESRAGPDGDAGRAAEAARLRRRLLGEHLGRWAGPFTRAMGAAAETAFYRELAGLTAAVVDLEARHAGLR
jgi:TorA maturation chaperone TorD